MYKGKSQSRLNQHGLLHTSACICDRDLLTTLQVGKVSTSHVNRYLKSCNVLRSSLVKKKWYWYIYVLVGRRPNEVTCRLLLLFGGGIGTSEICPRAQIHGKIEYRQRCLR